MIEIFVDRELCKGTEGCGLCIHVCPVGVYERSETLNSRGIRPPESVRPGDCTGCRLCMVYCPDLAIVIEKK